MDLFIHAYQMQNSFYICSSVYIYLEGEIKYWANLIEQIYNQIQFALRSLFLLSMEKEQTLVRSE